VNATLRIDAKHLRVPKRARDAVSEHRPVEVLSRAKPAYVLLHPEDYALVETIIDRRRRGLPVSIEDLLTEDDFAILAEEHEADGGLDSGILASWEK